MPRLVLTWLMLFVVLFFNATTAVACVDTVQWHGTADSNKFSPATLYRPALAVIDVVPLGKVATATVAATRIASTAGRAAASSMGRSMASSAGRAMTNAVSGGVGSVAAESAGALRSAYVAEVRALEGVGLAARAAGQDAQATARMLHQMRRDLGVQYKDLTPAAKLEEIYARNIKVYGDKLGPSIDYLRGQGKTWEQIIESASRPGGKDLGL